jgi:transcriptional regulator with XRE-family HTH domain
MCVPASLAAIADAAASSKQAVSNWRSGKKVPGAAARAQLEAAYAIPAASWGQKPVGRASSLPPARTSSSPPPPCALPTTMQGVEELLRVVREDRRAAGMLPSERMKLVGEETRLLGLKHRLEREAELLEDRIVKQHPLWARIRTAIGDTLVRWPEAAVAVAEKLREFE